MHKLLSHGCIVTNITLVVESEKRVISGHSSCVTIVENYFSFPWKSWNRRSHCSSVSNSDQYCWLLILTAVLVLAFFFYWKLQWAERSRWEIMFIINLYEIARGHPVVATADHSNREATSGTIPTVDYTTAGAVLRWAVMVCERRLYYLYSQYILT